MRKITAEVFMPSKKPGATSSNAKSSSAAGANSIPGSGGVSSLAMNPKSASSAGRRPDPIILLPPSASSLLRLSNIKSFLESGRYVPPEYSTTGGPGANGAGAAGGTSSSSASMLHLSRLMREIDPARPMRFILVEGVEQFKPEYWNRVVAVFTTGQTWQFKNYKWTTAQELFRHVMGVYVGWKGELAPESVKGWGSHRVARFEVDKWRDGAAAATDAGYKDKLVVEGIWKVIEQNMRSKGWRKDAGPASI